MKKIILSAFCLLPLGLMAQDAFNIKGNVKSLKTGDKVFLVYVQNEERKTDSAIVANGAFEFKGTIKSPIRAYLFLNKNPYVKRLAKGEILDANVIYLEGTTYRAEAVDSWNIKITGSKVNDEGIKLAELLKPVMAKIDVLNKEYSTYTKAQKDDDAFMKSFMDKYRAANKEKNPIYDKFISENPSSYISLIVVKEMLEPGFDPAVVEPIFLKLSSKIKESEAGKNVKVVIDGVKKTQVGIMAIDFTQNDPNDKPIKLSDFKGKYVLVDFWASWCGPCREENPNVVTAFNNYKDKNFTVLGVSLDYPGNKQKWVDAIAKDGLTWTQVSDLKGGKNQVAQLYGVQAIPFNFLVDPMGKIIARNLRGEDLQTKLKELLGAKSK